MVWGCFSVLFMSPNPLDSCWSGLDLVWIDLVKFRRVSGCKFLHFSRFCSGGRPRGHPPSPLPFLKSLEK
ncbi:hypothetical protein Dimus_038658 [Dionaea muscipula]